jgi:predicted secreted Zn-dependent protease
LRRKYENLLKTLKKHKEEENEIFKNNEKKLEEFVKKEIDLNDIIKFKENKIKNQFLKNFDKMPMVKTKEEHSKIQNFCMEIQNKFAKIIIQRETILIQVRL